MLILLETSLNSLKFIFMKTWMLFFGLCITLTGFGQDTLVTIKHGSIRVKKAYKEADHWPRIGAKMFGEITRKELCEFNGISTIYPYTIYSFTMDCSYLKDSIKLISNNKFLTSEMCKVIHVLPNGSVIHFENILVLDAQQKSKRLNSLRFTIVGTRD